MTAQERDQLHQFLAALRQQRSLPKDALADGLIRDALAHQPDALYWLVQRSLALQLALQAAQTRIAQLQAQCDEQVACSPALAPDATLTAAGATKPADVGAVQPSPWGRGLLAQVGGTALGVTTGVVAGGLLLHGLQGAWGPPAVLPDPGVAGDLPSAQLDTDGGLWDLGDDWA